MEGNYFIISLRFLANALERIELIISKYRFDLMANWHYWSEQPEFDIQKALRIWLINELEREGRFEWSEWGEA